MSLRDLLKGQDQRLKETYQQYLMKIKLLKEVKQDIRALAIKLQTHASYESTASTKEKADIGSLVNKL